MSRPHRPALIAFVAVTFAVAGACEVPNPAYEARPPAMPAGQPGTGGIETGAPMGGASGAAASTSSRSSSTSAVPDGPETRALVAYWPMDEGAGNVVRDVSGHGNDGALTDQLADTEVWVKGRSGAGLAFPNAAHAGVRVPPSASLDTIETAYSIVAWVRRAPNSQPYAAILSRGVMNSVWEHYSLTLWQARVSAVGTRAGMELVHIEAPNAVVDEQWFHAAATFDGSAIRLYVDGVQVAQEAYPGPVTHDGSPLYLGNNVNFWINEFGQMGITDEFFVGVLDDVALYARALSATEVKALAAGASPM